MSEPEVTHRCDGCLGTKYRGMWPIRWKCPECKGTGRLPGMQKWWFGPWGASMTTEYAAIVEAAEREDEIKCIEENAFHAERGRLRAIKEEGPA